MIIDFPLCFPINKNFYGILKSWNDQKNSGEDKSFETHSACTGTRSGVSDEKVKMKYSAFISPNDKFTSSRNM
jgi:hypothetical protein